MCFAQTNFPGETGVLNGGQGRRAGTTVVPTDGNDVRACFGNARSDDADSGTGYELNANARTGIDGAKVVDQLREVFDAVNVVVRGRRNQRRAGRGAADPPNVLAHFLRGPLAALPGLGALRPLCLNFRGVYQI